LPALDRRPQARAESVEDLVRLTREGQIRVPEFQRALKWGPVEVVHLFDSIYRGYPIGSLLLFRRPAEAGQIALGPLVIDAPEARDAQWVVDGQQRLVALAASFGRPHPYPTTPVDPFVVYFDAEARAFASPHPNGIVPDWWVPASLLLDAAALSEWIQDWPRRADLRAAVFDAGKRLREYQVPLYLIDSDNPDLLSEIFARINTSGKAMEWHEVFDALYRRDGTIPSTTKQLAEALSSVGMGTLESAEVMSCVLAIRGLDVTRTLAEHRRRDPNVLKNAVADSLPVLRQALSFLRQHASVPHLRLIPRFFVLEGLGRFFAKHPEPRARSLTLLTRWVWRVFMADRAFDERTFRRASVVAIEDDEEASVQALLALAPRDRVPISIPERFDARAARSRLAMLALAELGPRQLVDDKSVDVAGLLEETGANAFRPILAVRPGCPPALHGPSNRILLPGKGSARPEVLKYLRDPDHSSNTLASHCIDEAAVTALVAGDGAAFAAARGKSLIASLERMGERLAGWGRDDRDRPSIGYLLRLADGS
jgi:hypothetical protein